MRYTRITTLAAAGIVLALAVPAASAGDAGRRAAPAVSRAEGPSVTLAAGEARELPRVICPSGQTSTGGGVRLTPDNGVFIRESSPGGTGWDVRVHNLSDGPRTVTPLVVCTSDPTITHQVGNLVSGDTAVSGAGCPQGQVTAGGGAAAEHRNFLSLGEPSVAFWNARAKNTGFVRSGVIAFVRCSDRPHSLEGSSTLTPVPASQTRSAHAECPAGQVPTAGGGFGHPNVLHNASFPTATGWTIRATNTDGVQRSLGATVVCTSP
ncbi:hypothetical protein [Streptomyces tanashiensis]|uniref:Secreted protein n=1 Tax=Streptomyces tanashiensis TaxID=67367 RepID=A0ABY6R306_9ACTN|nr:hypothetical protein [Streptomyces tanashiensis]UZX23069.1 hypothetical protein LDH80_21110 [Streptomyces tanashiensis]GGY30201.1 hypothetical protein GCM10010299_40520 [Streptomyces tanashiensis]